MHSGALTTSQNLLIICVKSLLPLADTFLSFPLIYKTQLGEEEGECRTTGEGRTVCLRRDSLFDKFIHRYLYLKTQAAWCLFFEYQRRFLSWLTEFFSMGDFCNKSEDIQESFPSSFKLLLCACVSRSKTVNLDKISTLLTVTCYSVIELWAKVPGSSFSFRDRDGNTHKNRSR